MADWNREVLDHTLHSINSKLGDPGVTNKLTLQGIKANYNKEYLVGISESFTYNEEYRVVEDIVNSNNVLIVPKGKTIDDIAMRRIANFNLLAPIDKCLNFEEQIAVDTLFSHAEELKDTYLLYGTLIEDGKTYKVFKEVINNIDFDKVTLNKLTFIEKRDPSLMSSLVAKSLLVTKVGTSIRLSMDELIDLDLATLFSDFGLVYIDPKIKAKVELSDAEFRHIMVHPIISYIILDEAKTLTNKEYSERVRIAVLNHHEHLDGTGYPRRLKKEDIGLFERIITIVSAYDAEVQRLFTEQYNGKAEQGEQEEIINSALNVLKKHHAEFDQDIVDLMVASYMPSVAIQREKEITEIQGIFQQIQKVIASLIMFIDELIKNKESGSLGNAECLNLEPIVYDMRQCIAKSGLDRLDLYGNVIPTDIDEPSVMDVINDTKVVLSELRALLDKLYRVTNSIKVYHHRYDDNVHSIITSILIQCAMMEQLLEKPLTH